jgi:hypothetical protein
VSGLPSAALAPAAVALGAAGVPLLAVASVDASLAAKGDMPTLLRSGDVETRAIDVLAAVVASRNWTVAGAVAPRTDAGFARSVALQGALDARNVTLRVVADFAVEPDGAGDPSSVALALDVLALSGCRVAILLGDAASTPAVVDAAGAAGVLDSVAWLAIDGAMPDGWKRGGGRTFEGWLVATPVSYRSSDAAKKLRRSFDDAATAWDCEAYNSSQLYDGTIWDVADADDGSLACAGDGGASRAGSLAYVVVRRDEGSEADDAARNRLRLAFKLRSKWRILFVALQILTMYPAILSSVRYPKVYTELIGPFRVLGLDVPALLPLSCLTAGTFDYFASLRFMTLGPLLLVVGSCVDKQ